MTVPWGPECDKIKAIRPALVGCAGPVGNARAVKRRYGEFVDKKLRALAWFAVVGMFFVLLAGALVSKTGSGDGCGASWPLCEGQLLPAANTKSIIEYSHRAITGIVGIAVVAFAVVLWRNYAHRLEMRWIAGAAIFLLLLQSFLGAWVVLAPQPEWLLAIHFGVSSASFASVLLGAVLLEQIHGRGTGRAQPVSRRVRNWAFGGLAYAYAVIYSGAYVRHTNSNMACVDWPLCNGKLFPGFSGPVGIQFTHRLFALGAVIVLVVLARYAFLEREKRPDVYKGALWAVILVVSQVFNGGLVIWTRQSLSMVMLHSALITALFGVLSYVAMQVLPEPDPVLTADGEEGALGARQARAGA